MKPLTSSERPAATRVVEAEMDRRREALHARGFRPAFWDYATCSLLPSRDADGLPADVHVLDGLPEEVVVVRTDCGRVIAVKSTLVAGFERNGYFFTQAAACRAARDWELPARA